VVGGAVGGVVSEVVVGRVVGVVPVEPWVEVVASEE